LQGTVERARPTNIAIIANHPKGGGRWHHTSQRPESHQRISRSRGRYTGQQPPGHSRYRRRPRPRRCAPLALRPPGRICLAADRRGDGQERGVPGPLSSRRRLPLRLDPLFRGGAGPGLAKLPFEAQAGLIHIEFCGCSVHDAFSGMNGCLCDGTWRRTWMACVISCV